MNSAPSIKIAKESLLSCRTTGVNDVGMFARQQVIAHPVYCALTALAQEATTDRVEVTCLDVTIYHILVRRVGKSMFSFGGVLLGVNMGTLIMTALSDVIARALPMILYLRKRHDPFSTHTKTAISHFIHAQIDHTLPEVPFTLVQHACVFQHVNSCHCPILTISGFKLRDVGCVFPESREEEDCVLFLCSI